MMNLLQKAVMQEWISILSIIEQKLAISLFSIVKQIVHLYMSDADR
jgi:hypothetical protein